MVSWKRPFVPLTEVTGFVVGELESHEVDGMTVRVESRCWRADSRSASGQAESTAYIVGSLRISGKSFAGMTVRTVREVFGPETENNLDSGGVEFVGTDRRRYRFLSPG